MPQITLDAAFHCIVGVVLIGFSFYTLTNKQIVLISWISSKSVWVSCFVSSEVWLWTANKACEKTHESSRSRNNRIDLGFWKAIHRIDKRSRRNNKLSTEIGWCKCVFSVCHTYVTYVQHAADYSFYNCLTWLSCLCRYVAFCTIDQCYVVKEICSALLTCYRATLDMHRQ
jgi:hypothetical protein